MASFDYKGFNWREAWTKAPFLIFLWISYLLLTSIGVGIYFLVNMRLEMLSGVIATKTGFNPYFDLIALFLIGSFFFVLGGGLFLMTITTLTGIDLLYPHRKTSLTVTLLFPIATTLAQLAGINKVKLRTSFVKVNNSLTIAQAARIKGNRIMILLPHCLQIDICNRKITSDIHNCIQCGRCPVGSLVALEKKYNIVIEIVNGGTLARRKVAQFRPSGIVAVACERDLVSGIQDVYPIPVFGVLNDRPNGPCFNTGVDMELVENAINFFMARKKSS